MNKIKVLLKSPLKTQSGYGEHSRQIFDALSADPIFDIYCDVLNWGNCSYITENTEQTQKTSFTLVKRWPKSVLIASLRSCHPR